ncbi:MAG TPA: acyl-CoA reductase [Candidatus Binatia bacterium]|nr:acyl-CoA reductase [Candidatus Binatia bacterium]
MIQFPFTSYPLRFILQDVPALSPTELQGIVDQLLSARENFLAHCSVRNILSSLDRTVQLWLDPASPERLEAEAVLPEETGLSPEMIRHTLPLIFQEYRAERLEILLRDELGDPQMLDTFVPVPGGQRKAYGPSLITQVLAGNFPGAGLDGVIFALLVKSATLVKASSSAPFLPGRFSRSLAGVDPELASCLAVVTWPGGQAELEDIAFSQAEVVLASGADESLLAIRARVRGKFIGYGHKVSFSVIGKEALSDARALAQRAAYDVVLFDQQGCLSPQLVYVEEGGAVTPHAFAALLAQALELWQTILPRGRVALEESTAVQRVRDESEWQALAGKGTALYASPGGTTWTVIYQADPVFIPSPLLRTVRVKPLASLAQLEPVLSDWRPYLEAAGVAVDPARLLEIGDLLGRAGVSRVCPVGTMQTPPLGWRHGGRPRIADLVRWVGIEG